jgi:site-specific recombinase XerD
MKFSIQELNVLISFRKSFAGINKRWHLINKKKLKKLPNLLSVAEIAALISSSDKTSENYLSLF